MKFESFDLAIIGLGAVGSAALYQLSKTGAKVLGLDRFSPPHTMGSSHGESRITRLAVGEGEEYVALAKRSHEIWEEIELLSGIPIKTQTGGILIDSGLNPWSKHGSEGFWDRTVRFAKNHAIDHKIPEVSEITKAFPAFQIPAGGRVYFEKEAGFLIPELAIQVQLDLAKKNGAVLRFNSRCQAIVENNGMFEIDCEQEKIYSKKVIVCTGGWIKDFIPEAESAQFKICRQVQHWLETEPQWTSWRNYPIWMWGFGPNPEDFIYGFPSLDGRTVKMASESFLETDHPDLLNREVSREEQEEFWENKVQGRIKGLKKNVVQSKVCFYTVTADARFVIQSMENRPDFLWISACSGHGFKHSAALGEVLARKAGY